MNALVLGANLQIRKAFPKDLAFEDATADQFYLALFNQSFAALEPAQMGDQLVEIGVGDSGGRHAASRQAVADQGNQLLIVTSAQAGADRRSHFTAVSIGAMTARTVRFEQLLAGIGRLRKQRGHKNKKKRQCRDTHEKCLSHGCLMERRNWVVCYFRSRTAYKS